MGRDINARTGVHSRQTTTGSASKIKQGEGSASTTSQECRSQVGRHRLPAVEAGGAAVSASAAAGPGTR
jgi:hypothetical protein